MLSAHPPLTKALQTPHRPAVALDTLPLGWIVTQLHQLDVGWGLQAANAGLGRLEKGGREGHWKNQDEKGIRVLVYALINLKTVFY